MWRFPIQRQAPILLGADRGRPFRWFPKMAAMVTFFKTLLSQQLVTPHAWTLLAIVALAGCGAGRLAVVADDEFRDVCTWPVHQHVIHWLLEAAGDE